MITNAIILEEDLCQLLALSALNEWEYLIYVGKCLLVGDVVHSTTSPITFNR